MAPWPSITEVRSNVAETAGSCPGCEWESEAKHVRCTESQQYDEEYYGLVCPNCSWRYEHDMKRWYKPTPPGEESPTVDRA